MRRIAVAVLLAPLVVAGCSSAATSRPPAPSTAVAVPAADATTRWWSNAAAASGSVIDAGSDVAGRLHPSRSQYCGMLRQTVASGHSVLSGLRLGDPRYAAATKAFVTELEAVAPAAVAGSWQTLGKTIVTLVESSGDTAAVAGLDASRVRAAVTTVSADSSKRCGIKLSRAAG